MPILTAGHSTHEPEAFLQIIRRMRVDTVIDVRSHPSSKWEWWRREQMGWITDAGFGLEWWPALGGWDRRHESLADWAAPRGVDLAPYVKGHFPKQRIGASKPADQLEIGGDPDWVSGWTNQGLHDYAWFTALPEFQDGLGRLVERYGEPTQPRAVIICAELLWWKCHRSMVADVLSAGGVAAVHLTPNPRGVKAEPHPVGDRLSRYPVEARRAWRSLRP